MADYTPFISAGVVIVILMAIWIYFDAEIHNQDGAIWLILVVFLNILALLTYLIFFRSARQIISLHKATNRNEDFLIRGQHITGKSGHGKTMAGDMRTTSGLRPDPKFEDLELMQLIKSGKLSKARSYLNDMLQLAREMNDMQGVANYGPYEELITIKMKKS